MWLPAAAYDSELGVAMPMKYFDLLATARFCAARVVAAPRGVDGWESKFPGVFCGFFVLGTTSRGSHSASAATAAWCALRAAPR